MPDKIAGFITVLLSLAFCGGLLSCVTDNAPLQIESSLPQNELAYYNDTFDTFREDVWEKAGHVFTATQLENIKIADMTIEAGRLRIKTKTGGFSKGGLVSKFMLKGDFDVQIDLQIDFVSGNFDMDQTLGFGALDITIKSLVSAGLSKVGTNKKGGVRAGQLRGGRYQSCYWHPVSNFNGSFRLVRVRDRVSAFYRKKGKTRWTKMCTLPSGQNDTVFGIVLHNFVKERNSITANRSITAWIDNFAINAAQEIVESEI